MSRLHYDLVADRKSADIETDVFTRICTEQFFDTEEVRMDKPQTFDGTFEYVGVAETGSATSDAVWQIIRVTWTANRPTRRQFQPDMIWDDRTQGWPN